MLPVVIGREIEEGVKFFLCSTFPPATPAFENTLETFLDEPGRVFCAPWLHGEIKTSSDVTRNYLRHRWEYDAKG